MSWSCQPSPLPPCVPCPAPPTASASPSGPSGPVPRQLGLNRAALEAHGFTGKVGSSAGRAGGDGPTLVAVGVGDKPTARDAARRGRGVHAGRGQARPPRHQPRRDPTASTPRPRRRRWPRACCSPTTATSAQKTDTSVASKLEHAHAGRRPVRRARRGRAAPPRRSSPPTAANLARELANTAGQHAHCARHGRQGRRAGGASGLAVEVFDKDQLAAMGCGGMLGVNAGSVEPPRMVRLTYTPRNPKAHIALVGKGVMYDSGGLSLKPTDAMHAMMKMDMSGAAAVLAAMSTLKALGCKTKVTGYLMCTDNMPSGCGAQARRRADVPQRQDGRDPQHRRRGSPRSSPTGWRWRSRRAGRDRRHRHAHRCCAGGARADDRRP